MNIKKLYLDSYTKKEAALRNMMSPSLKNFIRDMRNAVFENRLIDFNAPAVRKAVVENAKRALIRHEQVLERYAKILASKGMARTNPDVLFRNHAIARYNILRSIPYTGQRDFTDPELTRNLFALGVRDPKYYQFNEQELIRMGRRKPLAIQDMYRDPHLSHLLLDAVDNATQAQAQPAIYLRNKQLLKQGVIDQMKSGDIF